MLNMIKKKGIASQIKPTRILISEKYEVKGEDTTIIKVVLFAKYYFIN